MFCSDVWLWPNNSLCYFASAVYLLAVYCSLILANSWLEEKKLFKFTFLLRVLIRKKTNLSLEKPIAK